MIAQISTHSNKLKDVSLNGKFTVRMLGNLFDKLADNNVE
jgi:hypothetical protein